MANRAVLSTPKFVDIPQRTIVSTFRLRSCRSSSVPVKAPHWRFVMMKSVGSGPSSGTIVAQSGGRFFSNYSLDALASGSDVWKLAPHSLVFQEFLC